jgi:hypothetical protein
MTYHLNSHLQDKVLKIHFHMNWQECEKTKSENKHTIKIKKKSKMQYTKWNKINFWKNIFETFTKTIIAVNITGLYNYITYPVCHKIRQSAKLLIGKGYFLKRYWLSLKLNQHRNQLQHNFFIGSSV